MAVVFDIWKQELGIEVVSQEQSLMVPFLLSHSEKGPLAPHQYWVYVFMDGAAVISPNVTAYLHNSSER